MKWRPTLDIKKTLLLASAAPSPFALFFRVARSAPVSESRDLGALLGACKTAVQGPVVPPTSSFLHMQFSLSLSAQ
jgi:hypothetical protein